MLQPLPGEGVTLTSTQGLPNDTARVAAGGVTADVTGRWSENNQTLEVTYRAGAAPASFAVAPTISWKGNIMSASHAWDRTTPVSGNVLGRPLLDAGPLLFKPRERRTIAIEFPLAANGAKPALGDEVTATLPMPNAAVAVRFRLGPE